MSGDFNSLWDSIDLTKDEEDSNDSVITSEVYNSPNHCFERAPPPLVPIPTKVSVPITGRNKKLPKLTRIIYKDDPYEHVEPETFMVNKTSSSIVSPQSTKLVQLVNGSRIYKINIPHNVIMAQGKGPVFMNIPGVGSMQLKLDPAFKNPGLDSPVTHVQPPSLQPISAIISTQGEKQENVFINETLYKNCLVPLTARAQPKNSRRLSPKKSKEENQLFIGFPKNDCNTSDKYLRRLNNIVDQYKTKLQKEMQYFSKLTKSVCKRNDNKNFKQQPDNFDDLLITKKVVILRNTKKKRDRPRNSLKKQHHILSAAFTSTKPIKVENWCKDVIKPCSTTIVDMTQLDNSTFARKRALIRDPNVLDYHQKQFEKRIIKTRKGFSDNIQFTKPLLLVNAYNYSMVLSFKTVYPKTNVVYLMDESYQFPKEVLQNVKFLDAVISGYIKIIDSEILNNFIKQETG
ncbi:uncharacterized protein LOC114327562 [Diabrotica virgifera virgifera]|uniref:Uncharacterized protein n=1 Tax=Diabrotica virgifera virgifera TaxID=50390 RepID=A0ABM5IG70_DIAVI|nr:uncharacterized protein LOC114327562 [Diabrotica virgifera virgifera]